jgi:colanic acid/amylovoran biosynthesis protein
MSENILVLNVHSFRNAGDAALTQATIRQLRENYPGCRITLVMNDPQSHTGDEVVVPSYLAWIQETAKWVKPFRFAWVILTSLISVIIYRALHKVYCLSRTREISDPTRATLRADIVVSTAGGYLYSYGMGMALMVIMYTIVLPLLAGKPVYLFPQSIGPFKYRRERLMIRWLLNRCRVVMVRDTVSLQHLRALGMGAREWPLIPDVAFAFPGAPAELAREWLIAHGVGPDGEAPLLGVTVIDWGAQFKSFEKQNQYEAAISAAARYFVARYRGRVLLLPQTWGPNPSEDDRIPAKRIQLELSDLGDSILAIEEPVPPELLKAVFGQMDVLIGTRMHSNVFALSQCVPVIAVGYLHKTLGIAETVGIEDWVIDIDHIDEPLLIGKLADLWSQRRQVRQELAERIPAIIKQTGQAGKLIVEDYAKWSQGASGG